MSKHTPGPWTQAPLSPVDILAADDTMIAMAREGLNGISRDQAIANARLIAAAPELLKALQMIEEVASGRVPLVNNWVASVARAAIAKANGEQA